MTADDSVTCRHKHVGGLAKAAARTQVQVTTDLQHGKH